jgi:polysaccharide export outer membrane protein
MAGIGRSDYVFGVGDVISVNIDESPELSGTFAIGKDGKLLMPYVGMVKAAGLNGMELDDSIAILLKKRGLLIDPIVSIGIVQYGSRTVQVLGAVQKPDRYSLEGPTKLLDVISRAGGLASNAGRTITISRQTKGSNPQEQVTTVDLSRLAHGEAPQENIEIQGGEVIHVPIAPIVYVLGAVNRPGGFQFNGPDAGITVLQAIALAEGLKSIAATKRCLLVRAGTDGQEHKWIPVDVASILARKGEDLSMQANDILYVPDSGSKKTLEALGRIAEGGAIGAVTYGMWAAQ